MRRLATIVFLSFVLGTSGACIVHTNNHGHKHRKVKKRGKKRCHPSQRWDGRRCRHKGKGRGARKHDGRR